ncbi:phage holin family protein [Carboxylicivirga sediminis]|uniref:Phage holin family protein n=1 Tax=Carboxylicivirga sediminis TaxID=2006564 RepID=A0A941F2G8_9BACT|nr:phage holin family protein [Carboxylicivirga sediminis]MBR8534535.1 phage holin family protein [Carboxylicivirga sediminis]
MKEHLSEEINEVKDEFEEYVNARLDLAKLHTAENLSRFFSGMLIKMGLFYLFFFVLLFISLAIAFWLNDLFEGKGVGFFIVAGFYLLIALLFYAMRKVLIQRPIIQSFVQLFFPKYTQYDESK